MAQKPPKQLHVVFVHPDLGIGGAERLVVDAAVALQNRGHRVTIFTSHCDPAHCFDEARDGTLDVRVRGNTLIPPTLFSRFAILCAILRQLHLILQIAILSNELRLLAPTAFFVDQLSAGIPLIRILQPRARILFYCHFPDKLLAKKEGYIKAFYRQPFDWLESWSTGSSDTIVVNSNFTKSVFASAFPQLRHRNPGVVYPCVETQASRDEDTATQPPWGEKKVLLSINRFEKKKDVALAIKAYAGLAVHERRNTRLVIAGGYDPRVAENIATYNELVELADATGLKHATTKSVSTALSVPDDILILFLHSIPGSFKSTLLSSSRLLVYTPRNEHFGIVPLEAMLAGIPVLAANEGGPTETVVNEETGWLRDVSKIEDWTDIMRRVVEDGDTEKMLRDMGRRGKERVIAVFSKQAMGSRLEVEIDAMLQSRARPPLRPPGIVLLAFGGLGIFVMGIASVMMHVVLI